MVWAYFNICYLKQIQVSEKQKQPDGGENKARATPTKGCAPVQTKTFQTSTLDSVHTVSVFCIQKIRIIRFVVPRNFRIKILSGHPVPRFTTAREGPSTTRGVVVLQHGIPADPNARLLVARPTNAPTNTQHEEKRTSQNNILRNH
jgi:hypothetical protein